MDGSRKLLLLGAAVLLAERPSLSLSQDWGFQKLRSGDFSLSLAMVSHPTNKERGIQNE